MQNLYDLLGVRPDDDAEKLRMAFRKAAKASHPDHHGGDPEAAARFRQITEAYEILRDAKRRAAYDRLLEMRRRPLRTKLKRAIPDLRRHIVTDVIIGVFLTIALASGYELFTRMPQPAIDEGAAPAQTSSQVAERGTSGPQMPLLIPAAVSAGSVPSAANGHDAPGLTKDESAPLPPGPAIEAARRDPGSDAPVSEAPHSSTRAGASGKRDGRIPESKSPDSRIHESAGAVTPEVKRPEPRTSARARVAMKRQAAGRPPMEQASLEQASPERLAPAGSRATPDTPRGDIAALFGVGY
jgi:curved DNA-binding protein CbpA